MPAAALERSTALALMARAPERTGLFVDYDGTLAPIVENPAQARPVPGASRVLELLGERLALVAVVSGRPAAFLLDELRLPPGSPVRIAGHYGIERAHANGEIALPEGAARYEQALAALGRELRHELPDGAELEQKRFGITFHWRRNPEAGAAALALAHDVARRSNYEVREGKLAVELVAPFGIDKASTVRELAASLEVAGAIGDDLGDLAAFEALGALAEQGALATVRIAVDGRETPHALFENCELVVVGPEEVVTLLEELARLL